MGATTARPTGEPGGAPAAPEGAAPLLEIEGLRVAVGGREILRGLDLTQH
jgi:hypothetical protein